MDTKCNYKNTKGDEKTEKLNFTIPHEKLLDFTECIRILTTEIGIVSFDMEDFEKTLKASDKVHFFASSGDDILSITNDFCNNIISDIIGGNVLVVMTSNSFSSKSIQFIESSLENINRKLSPNDIFYSIYEREVKPRYTLYIFCTVPN